MTVAASLGMSFAGGLFSAVVPHRDCYLQECFLCYTPPDSAPPVLLKWLGKSRQARQALDFAAPSRPAQENYGCVTFGCFNNLAKERYLVKLHVLSASSSQLSGEHVDHQTLEQSPA